MLRHILMQGIIRQSVCANIKEQCNSYERINLSENSLKLIRQYGRIIHITVTIGDEYSYDLYIYGIFY